MRGKALCRGVAALAIFSCSAIAEAQTVDPSVLIRRQEVLLSPFPVTNVKYVDQQGTARDVAWSTLSGTAQRELLPNEDTFVEIRRITSIGSLTILPAKVTAERGSYQFVYRWMKYRVQFCNPANEAAGHIRIGVGLDIVVDATTRRANLNVAGLGPLTLSASDDRFRGSMGVSTIGLGTNSAALSGFLGNSAISEHASTEADKAIAVVRAVLENNDTRLTPHQLAVVERTPGACTGEVAPAATPGVRLPLTRN
jgi:hypothetical protein